MKPLALALFALAAVSGCSTPETEGVGFTQAAMKGGCRYVCPKCRRNEPCPKAACRLECPPGATPCGDNTCRGGDVCCNASCGICTPPDGFCTQQACAPSGCDMIALCVEGYVWDAQKCACVPAPAECAVDADCTLADDYCTGCDCRALAPGEQLPACEGPGVQCFAQPCAGHTAACVNGTCTVQ